jgi:hypothetical protein
MIFKNKLLVSLSLLVLWNFVSSSVFANNVDENSESENNKIVSKEEYLLEYLKKQSYILKSIDKEIMSLYYSFNLFGKFGLLNTLKYVVTKNQQNLSDLTELKLFISGLTLNLEKILLQIEKEEIFLKEENKNVSNNNAPILGKILQETIELIDQYVEIMEKGSIDVNKEN